MTRILRVYAAALLAVGLMSGPSFAQDKMRMGLSSVSALHSAVWIAEQKGLFRKHGIDVEVIVTGQGGRPLALYLQVTSRRQAQRETRSSMRRSTAAIP